MSGDELLNSHTDRHETAGSADAGAEFKWIWYRWDESVWSCVRKRRWVTEKSEMIFYKVIIWKVKVKVNSESESELKIT